MKGNEAKIYLSLLRLKSARMRLREARIIPIIFGSHMGIWTCRDRSIIWLIAEDPIAIMIRNKEISEEFRNFFNVLWEHAGKK